MLEAALGVERQRGPASQGKFPAQYEPAQCEPTQYEPAQHKPILHGEPATEYEPEPWSSVPPAHLLATRSYSIRLAQPPKGAMCPLCGRHFLAAGPTGYRDETPVCDQCLLERVEELGMVLALIAVVRVFALSRFESRAEYVGALYELGGFARVYEKVAARSGPPRTFDA